MNKKLFLGMFAAVGMLFATSCQNDELDAVQSGNEATVSFTLGVEGGVQTRAISDGLGAKELHYRVFDENGAPISDALGKKVESVTSYPHEVKLTLAKGQTYKVAFWAQNAECEAYTVDENMNLTINYAGANNDEKRDAFFKTVDLTVTGNQTVPVVLKRPFAQLNVGVTAEDWTAAVNSGVTVAKSQVEISKVARTMNLVDGSVSDETNLTYDLADIPTQRLKVGDVEYHYLSMCYFLVNAGPEGTEKATLENVKFTFDSDGKDIVLEEGLNSVPVQRNWRTNIIGKLLTGDIQFNIVIDNEFDGENNGKPWDNKGVKAGEKYYATIIEAINDEATDLELAAGSWIIPSVQNKTLKITGANKDTKIDLSNAVTINGTSIEFKNVTIVKENEQYVGFHHAGNLKYTDCVFENQYWAYGTSETFENCVFEQESSDNYNIWIYGTTTAIFTDCEFKSAGKSVLIYNESKLVYDVDFNTCTFTASTKVDGKAAIQMHTEAGISGTLSITKSTATGFDGSINGGLWNELINSGSNKGQKTENFVITINGEVCDRNAIYINNLADFNKFRDDVNAGNDYAGKTVYLKNDIDLSNATWTPIGNLSNPFKGTFDGDNHIISNLKVNHAEMSGLFGYIVGDIKNVRLSNVTVKGNFIAGALVGKVYGTINNCHVDGGSVTSIPRLVNNMYDDANNVGGLIGYLAEGDNKIEYSSVKNLKINAYRDVAGLVGKTDNGSTVTNNTVSNTTIIADQTIANYNGAPKDANAGNIVGRDMGNTTIQNNTENGVKVIILTADNNSVVALSSAEALAYASEHLFAKGGVFSITNNIDMTGVEYKPTNLNSADLEIRGNNHIISNLSIIGGKYAALIGRTAGKLNISDLTMADAILKPDNNIDGEVGAAAFVGWLENHANKVVELKNCKSKDIQYGSSKYVGGLVAYQSGKSTLTIDNCTVEGATINSNYTEDGGTHYKGHAGGFIGFFTSGTIKSSIVKDSKLVVKKCTDHNRYGAAVGSMYENANFENVTVENVAINDTKATTSVVVGTDVDKRADKNTGVTVK